MKSAARTVIWILIFAATIAAYVLLAQRASAQVETTPPAKVFELRRGLATETWLYTADPASVAALRYDGTCVPDSVGIWYCDDDGNPVLIGHGTIDVRGMVAYVDTNLMEHEVAGAWFRFKKPWMRHNGAWDSLPFGVQMLDGTWKEPWIAQCVDSWQIWPAVRTSGPANDGFIAFVALCVLGIFALRSNRRRRTYHIPFAFEEEISRETSPTPPKEK